MNTRWMLEERKKLWSYNDNFCVRAGKYWARNCWKKIGKKKCLNGTNIKRVSIYSYISSNNNIKPNVAQQNCPSGVEKDLGRKSLIPPVLWRRKRTLRRQWGRKQRISPMLRTKRKRKKKKMRKTKTKNMNMNSSNEWCYLIYFFNIYNY